MSPKARQLHCGRLVGGAAPDAEGDDLPVEMAAFEKIIHAQHLGCALSKGKFAADMPRFSRLHQSRSWYYRRITRRPRLSDVHI